jgi:hypothetical protein
MARISAADSTRSSRVVAKKRPFGNGSAPVPGAAHALHRGGDGPGRIHLAHQVDAADIDAQLQRGGGHQ